MLRAEAEALCDHAVSAATEAGARYVEARVVDRRREMFEYKDGAVAVSTSLDDVGIGIRALLGDGWGYGATNVLTEAGVGSAARHAVATAAATADAPTRAVEPPAPVSGDYATPMEVDPFDVPLADKHALFAEAARRMLARDGVTAARGSFVAHRQEQTFVASNGSRQRQSVTLCGGSVSAIASNDSDVQKRSLPKSFEGNILQGGYEAFEAMDLLTLAEQAARESVALLDAEPTPEGTTTIILDGAQLSLQIHESVGHPTELDRVFGEEISLAGASFALPHMLNGFVYGADIVNLTADATTPLGPGTFGWDDEGTPATRTPIVEGGRFVGYLSGRDAAARLQRPSASALRAETWSRLPIVRMVNVNLEPGAGSMADLIAGVDEGLLLSVNKSWSIDDLRLNFQFSCEVAYEIRDGALTGRIFKNPVYYGVTPEFWRGCAAVAGAEEWQMWGYGFCGKGDPGQIMYVGHGCAPTRFDGVRVGHT